MMEEDERLFLTIIESPYAGEVERNKIYLRRVINDSLSRGEMPFASHAFFTSMLDDNIPEEREKGINFGFRYWQLAKTIAFYVDYGFSPGMEAALKRANSFAGLYTTEIREIGKNA